MFVPAPIDNNYVPYTKRSVLKRNAGLFVDGSRGRARRAGRVAPQTSPFVGGPCDNLATCQLCGPRGKDRDHDMVCNSEGNCVFRWQTHGDCL